MGDTNICGSWDCGEVIGPNTTHCSWRGRKYCVRCFLKNYYANEAMKVLSQVFWTLSLLWVDEDLVVGLDSKPEPHNSSCWELIDKANRMLGQSQTYDLLRKSRKSFQFVYWQGTLLGNRMRDHLWHNDWMNSCWENAPNIAFAIFQEGHR